MQIPLTLHCSSCRKPNMIGFDAEAPSFEFACACGHRNTGFADPQQPVAERLLRRALRVIRDQGDLAVAVVLAATPFEAQTLGGTRAWRLGGLRATTVPTRDRRGTRDRRPAGAHCLGAPG